MNRRRTAEVSMNGSRFTALVKTLPLVLGNLSCITQSLGFRQARTYSQRLAVRVLKTDVAKCLLAAHTNGLEWS
jgi:hypothetical protein